MPQPRLPSSGHVLVKLSDFSISRVLSPIGTKGFAGTEGIKLFSKKKNFSIFLLFLGYIAPEIVRFTGDELYTEKVRLIFLYKKYLRKVFFLGGYIFFFNAYV